MSWKTVVGSLSLLAVAGGVLAWSTAERRQDRYEAGIERSLLRMWAFEESDLRDEAPMAGVSMNRSSVEPLDRDGMGELAETEAFRTFFHRCTSCHMTPDPGIHRPGQWRGVVTRMERWMEKAGVLPLPAGERDTIVRFLDRASERVR